MNQYSTPVNGQSANRTGALAVFIGRGVGYFAMVTVALIILAGVVLLPSLAQLQQTEYRRDCDGKRVQEAVATVAAMDRLLAAAPSDEVLTKRLAWSRLGVLPSNEQISVKRPIIGSPAPGTLSTIRFENPPPPDPWINRLAMKVQIPAYRRGLIVMAGCLALAAMLLFAPHPTQKSEIVAE